MSSVKKSLTTKRAKFQLTGTEYQKLQMEALGLGLGVNNYSRLHSIAKSLGIDVSQNRCRTLLKDMTSGLTYEQWADGYAYDQPNTVELGAEDWALARALSAKANDPKVFDAIIKAARQIGDL